MSSSKKLAEFPDVEAKLQKPTKKSAFEQHKAEAAAKRQREAAEAEAVLKDFVKSFDRDDDGGGDDGYHNGAAARGGNRPSPARHGGPGGVGGGQPAFGGSSGRRHFGIPSTPSGMRSGPGSLGPPPPGFGKKRVFEGPGDRQDREDNRGRLAFDDHEPTSISKVFEDSDDEDETGPGGRAEEKAAAKPTLRLANLPPSTSPAVIKALIPPNLTVENVKILPPAGLGGTDRKSTTAIVTLSKETAANDMDAAVSALQNRYLGFGFYLSLNRHLSSAAISSSLTNLGSSGGLSHPFGAKPVAQPSRSNGPSHMAHGRGFAPPSSYGPPGAGPLNRSAILHVPVHPPKDIKRLRMIHKVIEGILQHGPEFEALLMSRPNVQKDEKWAWIWDARCEGGVWYRYRLWEIITGSTPRRGGQGKYLPLFEDSHAWKMPDQPLPYEYRTEVNEFVSDSEYNSSDDDDFDDEPTKSGDPGNNDQEDKFLNPLEKAKLAHLLARLPTTITKLRKGDIARVTAFAITHASRGADEIVDMIVSNVERPFSYTQANPTFKPDGKAAKDEVEQGPRQGSPTAEDKNSNEAQDTSPASLVGLYVVSDILSSSSTSVVRHAWRYRQLFEGALRGRKVFEGLGVLAEKLQWGRMRAEKWKRSVGHILTHWEGWCVFPVESHALFVHSFENPPSLKKEEKGGGGGGGGDDDDGPKKGKWKTVDATAAAQPAEVSAFRPITQDAVATVDEDADDVTKSGEEPEEEYMEYTDDEELDLEYLDEEDIDGEPILETSLDAMSLGEAEAKAADNKVPGGAAPAAVKSIGTIQMSSTSVAPSRKRLRAVDMFADSDSDSNA